MVRSLARPRFEVADVVRVHGHEYLHAYRPSAAQEKILRHISACRTAALGGHLDECNGCGHVRISYNSCRDRHCPKCQGTRQAEWLAQRLDRLLPVPYFHVVFTLPDTLNPLFLGNKKQLIPILFRAAAGTLLQIAADPRHLGAHIGVTAILHTWGRNLSLHPHLHCVVTGGGLSPGGKRWVHGRERFLLPIRVLGKLFRGKFLAALHRLWTDGHLACAGSTDELADPSAWSNFKDRLYRKNWVVYAKAPFADPEIVFRYLGRYTHRVAITNRRITDFTGGKVTFTVKDYADDGRSKLLTLEATEFLRRFLLHALPKRLVRIRHYGLSSARNVHTKLRIALRLLQGHKASTLQAPVQVPSTVSQPWWERLLALTGIDIMACPACDTGRLVRRQLVQPFAAVMVHGCSSRSPPETQP